MITGLRGVVVDVDDGREVDVDAERAGLDGRDAARLVREPIVAGRAERHRARKGRRPGDAEPDARLEVGRVEERHR